MREGMAARGPAGAVRVPIATGFQARTRRPSVPRKRRKGAAACACVRPKHSRVADIVSSSGSFVENEATPVTSIATMLLRNSSQRAFQRYPTHPLTPRGCHNQHFPMRAGSPCPEPEPAIEAYSTEPPVLHRLHGEHGTLATAGGARGGGERPFTCSAGVKHQPRSTRR